jgi:hypothetical protein
MAKEGATDGLFNHLCSILPAFLQHCHVKRNQADSYNKEREAGCEDFDKSFAGRLLGELHMYVSR